MIYSILRRLIQNALCAIKHCYLHILSSLAGWLNTIAFRLLVSTPKHRSNIVHSIATNIYNTTHRYLIHREKASCYDNLVDDEPSRRLLYPTIALLIGIQLMVYQLLVYAYPSTDNNNIDIASESTPHEIINMRTVNSKHFLNPDGTVSAVLYALPVHYKEASGVWKDINTNIEPYRKIDTAPYQVSFEEGPAYTIEYKGINIRLALKTAGSTQPEPSFKPDQPDEPKTDTAPDSEHLNELSDTQTIDSQQSTPSPDDTLQDLGGPNAQQTDSTTEAVEGKFAAAIVEETGSTQSAEDTSTENFKAEPQEQPTPAPIGDDNNQTDTETQGAAKKTNEIEDTDTLASSHFKSEINKNEIRYENVLQDTDLLISAEPYALEKWLILKSNAAPDTFEFSVKTNDKPRLVDQHLEWGELATMDCFAEDASGVRGNVEFNYSPQGDTGGLITLKVDKNFLAIASYPIRIDPTMTLNPSFDNGLNYNDSDTVFRTQDNYLVGKTSTSLYRMMLWFNMSSLAGKTVNSATFSMFENGAGKAAKTFNLYRMTEPWNTTYTSWNRRDDGASWTNAGGTYNTTRLGATYASVKINGAAANFDITNVVRKWIDGSYQNYGLLLKTITETNNNNNCGFYASEQGGAYQPKIVVNYNDIPGAPTGLIQYGVDHNTTITTGGTTSDGVTTNIYFDMSMNSPNTTDTLTPKVEIRPIGSAFTGTATHTGSPVTYSGIPVAGSVTINGLTPGVSYHWQAWVSNSTGDSAKTSYGGNTDPDGVDIIIGGELSLTIDSTYNRDGTPGSNSVNFGSVDPKLSPFVIHNDADKHAIQLTVVSTVNWSLSVQASGNLTDTAGNSIAIGQLRWRNHGSSNTWVSFRTNPYSILSGQTPTTGTTIRHNYRLTINWTNTSGNYGTTLFYTLSSP